LNGQFASGNPATALRTNWEVNLIVRCGLPKAFNSRK